jgi:hypothetical protein
MTRRHNLTLTPERELSQLAAVTLEGKRLMEKLKHNRLRRARCGLGQTMLRSDRIPAADTRPTED